MLTSAESADPADQGGPVCRWPLPAAVIAGLQGLVVSGLGVGYLVATVAQDDGPGFAAGAFALLCAVAVGGALVLGARGLLQGARWARGPVLTWQVFLAPIAWSAWSSGRSGLALAVAIPALVALVAVVAPPRRSGTG